MERHHERIADLESMFAIAEGRNPRIGDFSELITETRRIHARMQQIRTKSEVAASRPLPAPRIAPKEPPEREEEPVTSNDFERFTVDVSARFEAALVQIGGFRERFMKRIELFTERIGAAEERVRQFEAVVGKMNDVMQELDERVDVVCDRMEDGKERSEGKAVSQGVVGRLLSEYRARMGETRDAIREEVQSLRVKLEALEEELGTTGKGIGSAF
jgi:methyl-accepting chemotaxis protein